MTDLTKITTPFGLLDAETQRALQEHGGPWEFFNGATWSDIENPNLIAAYVYRVKSQPPKPREWWMVKLEKRPFSRTEREKLHRLVFETEQDAADCGWTREDLDHVREVI